MAHAAMSQWAPRSSWTLTGVPPSPCPGTSARRHARRLAVTVSSFSLDTLTGGDLAAAGLVLPALGGAALTIAAAKFAAYSQMEVVRTGMLGRHVRAGGARVLQLGGATRDLYYYPKGTVQVTVAGPDVSVGLWEQAGMQAGVPVRAVKAPAQGQDRLSFMAGGSVDSVVAFDQLGDRGAAAALLAEVWRVLKPGGTFVFLQRVSGTPVAALVRLGGAPAADGAVPEVVGDAQPWDFMEWDLAVGALDPHAVGVAVKPLQAAAGGAEFSVDATAFEQLMKSKGKAGGKQGSEGKGGGKQGRKGFSAR